jgi:hypothetical protein
MRLLDPPSLIADPTVPKDCYPLIGKLCIPRRREMYAVNTVGGSRENSVPIWKASLLVCPHPVEKPLLSSVGSICP